MNNALDGYAAVVAERDALKAALAECSPYVRENERLIAALENCVTDENATCFQTPGYMARRIRKIDEIARAALGTP